MNLLKALGKRRDGGGDLCGRTLFVDGLQVKVDTLIGEGGFASIYRVTELKSRGVLALKHFRLGGDPDAVQSVYKEIGLLDELKDCPNTLSLVAAEFSRGEEDAFVLLEHCQQNLATFLRTHPGPLDLVTIISIFQPVCSAIQAMHCLQPPTVHRDVKAENVLLHPEGRWLLCDFGSATTRQQACSSTSDIAILEDEIMRNTTPAYRAPEMWDLYSREFIGVQADIWALGCLLYLLCFGRLPFEGEAKLQILNGRYEMHPGVAAPLKELIGGMLTVNVMERWDIHQVQRSVGALGAQLAAEPRLVDQAQVQQEGAALEPRAADKVTEVEALKDLVSAKEQQIQALRVQLLEARQPSMNGGINLQQTSLPSHDTSILGRAGSYSHSRNSSDTPSNSSSPTKAHRSLARSFTTGSNLTPQRCASPMRVLSGSTALSKPATRMQHSRNVSQPACFEQLDPLG